MLKLINTHNILQKLFIFHEILLRSFIHGGPHNVAQLLSLAVGTRTHVK